MIDDKCADENISFYYNITSLFDDARFMQTQCLIYGEDYLPRLSLE